MIENSSSNLATSIADPQSALAEQKRIATQAESELAAIYDNAPFIMLVISSQRQIVKLNHTALHLAGLTEEEALGRCAGDLFRCQHAGAGCGLADACKQCLLCQSIQATLERGAALRGKTATMTVKTEQGLAVKYLSLSTAPINLAGERRALVFIDDVTDLVEKKRQGEASDHQAQDLYRQFETLLNAIDDPICLLSREFELLWTNQAYRDLQESLGSDQDGLTFRHCFSDPQYYPVQQCFDRGRMAQADIVTDDNRIWQLRAFPLLNSGEIHQALLIAIDNSEKEQLQEEALRTSRLASLGMLAAGVAHEINNPNAFILYNSDILQGVFAELFPYLKTKMGCDDMEFGGLSWPELEQELPNMFAAIQEGAQRIKRIVADLRDYARHENQNDFSAIDLNEVAATAVRLVQNPLKKSTADFSMELAPGLPLIHGDFGRLEQVVINLLLNSCQALTKPEQAIRLQTMQPNREQVVLQVVDEGQGIPAEILQSVTQPFTTTKRGSGGTGLGLSVSNRIVQAHHGELRFESQPGEPTRVSLILPIPKAED